MRKECGRQVDGSWATSQEAAYPPALCSQFASLVLQAAQEIGWIRSSQQGSQGRGFMRLTKAQSGTERAAQGLFPRGIQAPPLVEPFPRKEWYQVPASMDRSVFVPGKRFNHTKFPKGSTTLAVLQQDGVWWAHVGIPVEPQEFLALAAVSIHPESQRPVLPEFLQHTVHRYCSKSAQELSEHRVSVLKSMLQKAEELRCQEAQLHSTLEPHARDVLKGKHSVPA